MCTCFIAEVGSPLYEFTPWLIALYLQISSLRIEAKDLARSVLSSVPSRDGASRSSSLDPVPPCPRAIWMAVAPSPSLYVDVITTNSGAIGGEDGLAAPCAERAERVRASLEQAIDLKPDLEAARVRTEELVSCQTPSE